MAHDHSVPPGASYMFLTDQEYWAELYKLVSEARSGDRILLMTMKFEPTEPPVARLADALFGAAHRGAAVTFGVDANSFLLHNGRMGPLWSNRDMPHNMPVVFRNKLNLLQDIDNEPTGRAVIINKPSRRFSLPVAGRSHIKVAIVNDRIFIGGCNLQDTPQVDMMVTWRDKRTADWLYQIMLLACDSQQTREAWRADHRYSVDEVSDIFIDSGQRGRSLIFDQALELIDSAEKWLTITCQFFPNSVTARHLLEARRRGVKVEVIWTHPSYHCRIGGLGQRASILREHTRVPKELFQHGLGADDPMLHAKLIACDKGVMLGSHNYVRAGVRLGTAEIALLVRDKKLAREAVRTLQRTLKQAKR